MTVWHLTRTLSGGAGQYALRLSRALEKIGVDSVVLSVEGPDLPGSRLLGRRDGRWWRLACRTQRSLIRRVSKGAYHSLRGWESYDVPGGLPEPGIVHLHGMTGWIGVGGLNRLIPAGAALFQTTHSPWDFSGGCVLRAGAGCDAYMQSCGSCPMLKSPWQPLARSELKLRTRWVRDREVTSIANSRWMAERVAESRVFGERGGIPVIPPIVSDAYARPGGAGLREELGIGDERRLIGLGAKALTDAGKGIREFVERLASHHDLCRGVTVALFGDGRFSVPAGLDVRFLGPIHDETRLAEIYRSLDLFVSPSEMETFGMTLVEAQAAGAPVVGFDVGGVRDAIFPGHRDRLVPLGEWPQLLLRIEEVLQQEYHVSESQELRNWAGSSFSGETIARRQLKLYEQRVSTTEFHPNRVTRR